MWLIARVTQQVILPGGLRLGLVAGLVGFGLGMGGAGFRAFARARTTIDPVNLESASALVTTGVFRLSRNPMYVGFAARELKLDLSEVSLSNHALTRGHHPD